MVKVVFTIIMVLSLLTGCNSEMLEEKDTSENGVKKAKEEVQKEDEGRQEKIVEEVFEDNVTTKEVIMEYQKVLDTTIKTYFSEMKKITDLLESRSSSIADEDIDNIIFPALREISKAYRTLDITTPPEGFENIHEQFKKSLGVASDSFTYFTDFVDNGNYDALNEALDMVIKSVKTMGNAQQVLFDEKGISIETGI